MSLYNTEGVGLWGMAVDTVGLCLGLGLSEIGLGLFQLGLGLFYIWLGLYFTKGYFIKLKRRKRTKTAINYY